MRDGRPFSTAAARFWYDGLCSSSQKRSSVSGLPHRPPDAAQRDPAGHTRPGDWPSVRTVITLDRFYAVWLRLTCGELKRLVQNFKRPSRIIRHVNNTYIKCLRATAPQQKEEKARRVRATWENKPENLPTADTVFHARRGGVHPTNPGGGPLLRLTGTLRLGGTRVRHRCLACRRPFVRNPGECGGRCTRNPAAVGIMSQAPITKSTQLS